MSFKNLFSSAYNYESLDKESTKIFKNYDEIVKENDNEIQSSVEFETPELPNIDDLF